jgi:hypothetical protein
MGGELNHFFIFRAQRTRIESKVTKETGMIWFLRHWQANDAGENS